MADDGIMGRAPGITEEELAALGLDDLDEVEADAAEAPDDNTIGFEDIYDRIRRGDSLQVVMTWLGENIDDDELDLWTVVKDYGLWLEENRPPGWNSPQQLGAVKAALASGKAQSDARILHLIALIQHGRATGLPAETAEDIIAYGMDPATTAREVRLAVAATARKDARRGPPAPPSSPSPGMDGRGRRIKTHRIDTDYEKARRNVVVQIVRAHMRGESIKGIIDFLKANPAYADPTIRFSAAEWRAIEKEIPQVLELNLSDNPDDPYLTEGEDAEEEEMPDDLEGEGRAAKTMRPPICRVGTKASILDKVFKAFPDDSAYDTYVEPFIGGGAVYWAKDPTKREVINDLDSELIELYRTLKTTRSRDVPTDLTSKAAIQSFFDKGKPPGDMRKLAYGIVASCNRWMGRQTGNIIYKESDPAKKLRKLDEYQERMKGTTILNESYEKVLRRFDSPRTFFYLDPPYEDSKTLYKAIEKTGFDFEKLRDELSRLKGKWLLSINDSKYIRDLFKGFYARGFVQKARGKGLGSIGNKDRKELLIANYAF